MESRKPDVSDLAQYKLAKFVGTQGYQGRVHRALSAAAGQVSPSLAITSDYNIQDEEDREEQRIHQLKDDLYELSGRVEVEDFEKPWSPRALK